MWLLKANIITNNVGSGFIRFTRALYRTLDINGLKWPMSAMNDKQTISLIYVIRYLFFMQIKIGIRFQYGVDSPFISLDDSLD